VISHPAKDIVNRLPVWSAMSDFYVDNELTDDRIREIAKVCSDSPYTLRDLEKIMFTEVWPAFVRNLFSVAGEWVGWSDDVIIDRIIKNYKNRFYFSWRLNPLKIYFCRKWLAVEKEVARKRGSR